MSILKTLREKLSSEDYTKVMDAVGDDFNWDLVPRSRLDSVIKQRNTLRDELAGSSQAGAKSKENDDDDDDDGNTPPRGSKGQQKQGGGQAEVNLEELKNKHQQELDALKVRYSAVDKLRAAGAKDPDLILNAGLLDLKLAKVAKDGSSVTWPDGDNDPFTALKTNKDRAYLFSTEDGGAGAGAGAPKGTGKEGGSGDPGGTTIKEAYAAAIKSGDSTAQARLIREAFAAGIELN